MAALPLCTGVQRTHLDWIVKVEIQLLVIEFAWLCGYYRLCLPSRCGLRRRRPRLWLGPLLAARRRHQPTDQEHQYRRRKSVANSPQDLAPLYRCNWVRAGYFRTVVKSTGVRSIAEPVFPHNGRVTACRAPG